MLTKEELIKQLSKFKSNGKPVAVHTSLKAIGEIDGGAETLLSALTEHFTRDRGLLIVSTHTWDKRILDLNKSESCIGVLPKVAAAHKDGVRSKHPTHSVTAFGHNAEAFVKDDESVDTPTSPNGSYGKLYDNDGYVLLIGVGQEKNTYIHCVEEMLKYPRYMNDKVNSRIIYKDGTEKEKFLYWFDSSEIPDVSENFGKFEAAFDYHGCIQYGTLGNAKVQFCSAKKIKEVMELIYNNADGKELLADKNPLEEKLYKI